VALTLLGSTGALAAPSSRATPAFIECQQTTPSAFINSYTTTSHDADGNGSKLVQLTIQAQKLVDAIDGAYCGKVRSHQVIKCTATTTCTSMHLNTWMEDCTLGICDQGNQTKYVASLAPNATNTVYSSWVAVGDNDRCNWWAAGYYRNPLHPAFEITTARVC
jgi:hypothetical protein